MGTFIGFYVRNTGDAAVGEIRKRFPAANIESGEEFLGVTLGDDAFEPPAERLVDLSTILNTDVVWLSFQSAVDAFEFHHWQAGKTLRSLVFGCYQEERTWERAEGDPEPWERAAFFDEKALRSSLEFIVSEQERRELERIWRDAELVAGAIQPSIDSREAAWKVAEHYRLPGWV